MGYSAMDIITTLFRVVKTFPDKDMPEYLKLEFIRVKLWTAFLKSCAGGPRGFYQEPGRVQRGMVCHCIRVMEACLCAGSGLLPHADRGRCELAPAAVWLVGQALQEKAAVAVMNNSQMELGELILMRPA